MTYQLSPFVEVGDNGLVNDKGIAVTPLFQSDHARLILISSGVADTLRCGGDVGETHGRAIERSLLDAEIISASPENTRRRYHAQLAERDVSAGSRAVVLLPTSYCNMGCSYCGQEHTKESLGPTHREAVLERLRKIVLDPETQELSIRWFGGEPLMAYANIRWFSTRLIPLADREGVTFGAKIVTNGSLLDARKLRGLVEECRVKTINITIDGVGPVHDAHRPLKNGRRSFAKLMGVLREAMDDPRYSSCEFQLRTNVDIQNSQHVDEYLDFMAANGFADRPNVVFDLHEVHSWGNDVAAQKVDRNAYAQAEVGWLRRMDALGLRHMTLPNRPTARVCVAVSRDSEVIDAKGSVFACTEQPLVPTEQSRGLLTTLESLGATARRPPGEFDRWPQQVAAGEFPCSTCTLLPTCGGHCPKSWYDGTAACPSIRRNIKERMNLQVVSSGRGRTRGIA